jgi:hypothetical protein
MIKLKDLLSEASLVGYDKSYLDNAKKKLKVSHEITDIEYKKTRQHDKFVKISYKLKWKPGTRLDTEEKDVNVFYDSPERLKMIGKTLKLKLKESVKEASNPLPRATLSLLNSKLNKASEAIIKITDKYKKQGDIDGLVKIWMRGLHLRLKKGGIKIESVNEKVAKPFSEHLRKAQDEIEYMISNGPTPDGDDGVYDKPREAMKLLQIAQKSLGKIK